MSVPRQSTPSHSPTPSKSSIRRTSGTQNPSQRSLLPPPSPRFEDDSTTRVRYSPRSPPNQTLEYDSDEDEDDGLSEEEARIQREKEYFPQPIEERPFQPFFTLIEDGITSEHHHPSVHYIFADDDHDIITEAALRSLEQDGAVESYTKQSTHEDDVLPTRVKEHYLVLDVHPIKQTLSQTDDSVTSQPFVVAASTSLSPEWQITDTSILLAPTLGESNEDEGLMLRIEGRGLSRSEDTGEKESVEGMIELFQQGLGEVRRLMKSQIEHVGHDFEEQD